VPSSVQKCKKSPKHVASFPPPPQPMPLHIGNGEKSISGGTSKMGGLFGSASKVGVGVCSSVDAKAVLNIATPSHTGDDGESISGSAIKVGGLPGSASKVGGLSSSASEVGVGVCSLGVAKAFLDVALPSHTGDDGKSISGSASKVGGLSGRASKVGVGAGSLGIAESVLEVPTLVGGTALRIAAERTSSCKGIVVGVDSDSDAGLSDSASKEVLGIEGKLY
jgi:hypothetical protein